jgi:hypothetical protein
MKVKLAQGEGLADSIESINRGMQWVMQNKNKNKNKNKHNIKVSPRARGKTDCWRRCAGGHSCSVESVSANKVTTFSQLDVKTG